MKTKKVKSTKTKTFPKGTGRKHVYDLIRRLIVDLSFMPGAELDEIKLVAKLGVSRTLVREALIRLGAERLVVLLPNRGARVAPIDAGDLRSFFEAIDLCQRATSRWAALRHGPEDLERIQTCMVELEEAVRQRDYGAAIEANYKFHTAIAASSGNGHISDSYDRLLVEYVRLARLAVAHDVDGTEWHNEELPAIIKEHRELFERIAARDADNAERLAGRHAESTRQHKMRLLSAIKPDVSIQAPAR